MSLKSFFAYGHKMYGLGLKKFKCALNDYYSASSYLFNLHFKFYLLRFFFNQYSFEYYYVHFILNWNKMFDLHTSELSTNKKIVGLYIHRNSVEEKNRGSTNRCNLHTYIKTWYKTKIFYT